MSNFKEKSQGFIIGILVGLVVAGGFFVFKLDDYFKELNFYKSVSHTFSSDKKTEEPSVKEAAVSEQKEKKVKPKSNKVSDEEQVSDGKFASTSDSIKISKDSLMLENPTVSDEVVVRKDALISTKTLEIVSLDPTAKMTAKDSLLQKVSGIKEDKINSKQFLNIELWSSPLNYKGYKMSKYKLVLYGIASAEGIKLYKLDDVVYLKSASLVYRLDAVGDFKPYERITDEFIINKLK
ncbi:hypothetical protein BH10BAC1_BH10BAC1_13810 [soil metagenome]